MTGALIINGLGKFQSLVTFTCSNSTVEILEKGVKSVQSQQ